MNIRYILLCGFLIHTATYTMYDVTPIAENLYETICQISELLPHHSGSKANAEKLMKWSAGIKRTVALSNHNPVIVKKELFDKAMQQLNLLAHKTKKFPNLVLPNLELIEELNTIPDGALIFEQPLRFTKAKTRKKNIIEMDDPDIDGIAATAPSLPLEEPNANQESISSESITQQGASNEAPTLKTGTPFTTKLLAATGVGIACYGSYQLYSKVAEVRNQPIDEDYLDEEELAA